MTHVAVDTQCHLQNNMFNADFDMATTLTSPHAVLLKQEVGHIFGIKKCDLLKSNSTNHIPPPLFQTQMYLYTHLEKTVSVSPNSHVTSNRIVPIQTDLVMA